MLYRYQDIPQQVQENPLVKPNAFCNLESITRPGIPAKIDTLFEVYIIKLHSSISKPSSSFAII